MYQPTNGKQKPFDLFLLEKYDRCNDPEKKQKRDRPGLLSLFVCWHTYYYYAVHINIERGIAAKPKSIVSSTSCYIKINRVLAKSLDA